jgi:cytochrome bd-type quinol oxidase subunit 2
MRRLERLVAYLCGGFLCLMAIGHGIAFFGISKSLAATAIDLVQADAIRTVWLTVSVVLAAFGLLVLRATHQAKQADWIVIVAIGAVLVLSGSAGLAISAGQPFWLQHAVLGLAILTVGWRLRGPRAIASREITSIGSGAQ